MAFIHLNYYSHKLHYQTDLNVTIPIPDGDDDVLGGEMPEYFPAGKKYQVLYLLHGTCGDCYDWLIKTNVERLAQKHRLALVMPSCQNTFFLNMDSGPDYLDFLIKELPEFITGMFPISKKREDTFIAGISMGGYGAWHAALAAPDRFEAAASLSGVLEFPAGEFIEPVIRNGRDDIWPFRAMLGRKRVDEILADTKFHLLSRIEELQEKGGRVPKLFMTVGTEDFTYKSNQAVREQLDKRNVSCIYTEGSGSHNWFYWNEHLPEILDWLPLKNNPV